MKPLLQMSTCLISFAHVLVRGALECSDPSLILCSGPERILFAAASAINLQLERQLVDGGMSGKRESLRPPNEAGT